METKRQAMAFEEVEQELRRHGLVPIRGGSTMAWDLKTNSVVGRSLAPSARTATANGSGVDFQNCDMQIHAILDVGAVTDGAHTITFEESKNDNTGDAGGAADAYAAVESADANAALVANTPQVLRVKRAKRYVRAVTTIASATTGATYGVVLMGQKKVY